MLVVNDIYDWMYMVGLWIWRKNGRIGWMIYMIERVYIGRCNGVWWLMEDNCGMKGYKWGNIWGVW